MIKAENKPSIPARRGSRRRGVQAQANTLLVRKKAARRRRLLIWCLALGLCVECAAGALTSPWFNVRRVTVHGLDGLSAEELDAAVRASRLPPGTNLFSRGVSSLADRLSAQAFVEDARIVRRIPPQVSVYVTPRAPFAAALIAGRHWELDRRGIVIRRSLPTRGLPIIEQTAAPSPMPGERIADETFLRALDIVDMLDRKGDPEFTKIVVDPRAHLCLNMSDGLIIRLGLAESLNQKVALIRKIYQEQPNPADLLKSVDLTAPAHPVCVPRPESEKRKNESA